MDGFVMLGEAALRLRMSRERLLRKIQLGDIAGQLVAGRWLVSEMAVREREAAGADVPVASLASAGRRSSTGL